MLHLGHAELGQGPNNVIFLEARMREDLREAVEKASQILKASRVGVPPPPFSMCSNLGQALDVLKGARN